MAKFSHLKYNIIIRHFPLIFLILLRLRLQIPVAFLFEELLLKQFFSLAEPVSPEIIISCRKEIFRPIVSINQFKYLISNLKKLLLFSLLSLLLKNEFLFFLKTSHIFFYFFFLFKVLIFLNIFNS